MGVVTLHFSYLDSLCRDPHVAIFTSIFIMTAISTLIFHPRNDTVSSSGDMKAFMFLTRFPGVEESSHTHLL